MAGAEIERLLRLAAAACLEGVAEGVSYGTPSLKLRGKFLARLREPGILAIVCPLAEKEILMQAEPQFYFETDHYKGWDSMLIRLDTIDDARLTARLEQAWRMKAGRRAIAALDAARAGQS